MSDHPASPPTELGDADRALRESDAKYRDVFEHMTTGFTLCRVIFEGGRPVDYVHEEANLAFEAQTGLRLDAVLGRRITEVLPGIREDPSRWIELLGEVARTGTPIHYEQHVAELDRWYEATAYRPKPGYFAVVFLDVTERKRTEERLRESEQRYRSLFDNMTEGFFLAEVVRDAAGKPMDFRFLDANPALEPLTGLRRSEIRGRTAREVLPGIEDSWIEIFGRVAVTGEPARIGQFAAPLQRYFETVAYSPRPGQFACVFSDVTDRKQAEEALRQSTLLLRAISDTSQDAIFAKDREGRLRFANPATLALIGKPLPEVLGKTDAELLSDAAIAAKIMENDRRIMEGGVPVELEEPLADPTGSPRVFLSRKTPYRGASGDVIGLLGISRDITERKRMEEALHRANERLRDADRRKDEFISLLSHELRNPLAPIRNSIHILDRAAPDSAQAARAKEVIRRQTDHLTRLVDDLLDVTRVSRGKIQLQCRRLDLRDVVRRTCDDHRAMFEERGIELRIDTTPGAVWVDADATRIAQVAGNLLQNAAKFTSEGGVVSVHTGVADGRAELRVRDDGVGMNPEEIDRMFEPFAQAERSLARTHGGLGLGLALVRGLVELHGGIVRAHSGGPGRGAEFVVTLPLAPTPEAPAPDDCANAATTGRHVLIIEDNLDAGQSLADFLELSGHRVALAHDGRTGIALARELRPDVVLCDIGLPDVSGYEVARTLRADERLRGTRLVALSGYAQPEDRERAMEAGFEVHLPKPPPLESARGAARRSAMKRWEERPPVRPLSHHR